MLPDICDLFCGNACLKASRKVLAGWNTLENLYLVNYRIHQEAQTNENIQENKKLCKFPISI